MIIAHHGCAEKWYTFPDGLRFLKWTPHAQHLTPGNATSVCGTVWLCTYIEDL